MRHEHNRPIDHLERLHDLRLVRASQVKNSALWIAILVSWAIAFVEYCFQVPANRIGHGQFSAAQLKTIQEVITLVVFAVFSVLYLKEALKWNYIVGFACILAAVFFVFKKW